MQVIDAKDLYNHVDGEDGPLDAVAEHLLGAIALPAPTGDPSVLYPRTVPAG